MGRTGFEDRFPHRPSARPPPLDRPWGLQVEGEPERGGVGARACAVFLGVLRENHVVAARFYHKGHHWIVDQLITLLFLFLQSVSGNCEAK